MKDYVIHAGPLRTFDALYDPRLEKSRQMADYDTMELIGRPGTQRRHIAERSRSADRELNFVSSFFAAADPAARVMCGMRDVFQGKASLLANKLKTQGRLRWVEMKYGISEDDFVLVELQKVPGDFSILHGFFPPHDGGICLYSTIAPFDIFEINWRRAAQGSLKSQEDKFRRDAAGLAPNARIALIQDSVGSFTLIVHPDGPKIETVESHLIAAGKKAGMSIQSAPGLFS